MKIEIVTRNLKAGGAERVISQLINFWSEHGIKCTLVLLEESEHFYKINPEIQIVELEKKFSNKIINKFFQYFRIRKITKKIKPDIVLSLPEEIGIYVILSLMFIKVSVFVSERNNPWVMPYKKSTRFLRKVMYPFAKGIVFQTEGASLFFSKKIREKGIVLPNPIDLSRFKNYNRKIDFCNKNIISAGRLEKQKNFGLLIDAFKLFNQRLPGYTLTIYGDGSERKILEKQIVENKLEKVVFLPGKTNNLIQQMQKSRMFVLSSDYEGVPNVLIEAMATGLPCVSTNCKPGGAASIIDDNKNGYLVPIGDATQLSERMVDVLTNPAIERKFISNCKNIKNKYDICKVGPMWLDFLRKGCQ